MDLIKNTALTLGKMIKNKEISVKELAKASIDSINAKDKEINAFIKVIDENEVLSRADEVQKKIDGGDMTGPLAGLPVAVKDNICTKGIDTTCASKMLKGFVPPYDATAAEILKKEGCLIVGKTNMDEFAMGSTSETSHFGPVKNPWDLKKVPGGSSGGSAAAVAAGEVPFALGSDTGGSIRQPASYCGVVGIKPTYGTVSRSGLIAYGSSLDQIGPIAADVADCAAILDVIMKHDSKDSTSVKRNGAKLSESLKQDIKGLKIGFPTDFLMDGLDAEVKNAILKAAETFKSMGAEVEEFNLNLMSYAVPAYYIIASAEASSNLSRFDGVKYGYRTKEYEDLHEMYKKSRSEGFGDEVKRRIMLGSFVLSSGYYDAYYIKALKTKTLIKQAFDEAFSKYDVILGPVAPQTAPVLGESLSDPLKMYLSDIYTVLANLAGIPGISLPCGYDKDGMPIGMQLLGDCFCEDKIINAAFAFEGTMDKKRSPLAEGREAL